MTTQPQPLTPEEIAELRRLDAEATPGPWVDAGGVKSYFGGAGPGSQADTALIAATRNALPRLLDAAEALAERTRERDALQAERDGMSAMLDRIAAVPSVEFDPSAEECVADGVDALADHAADLEAQLAEYRRLSREDRFPIAGGES